MQKHIECVNQEMEL